MRLILLISLVCLLPSFTVGQSQLTFYKGTDTTKTFKVKTFTEVVYLKPLREKVLSAIIVEYSDTIIELRCKPLERKKRKENRTRFAHMNLNDQSQEAHDSIYLVTIYSDLKRYHISDLRYVRVPMDKRPEREGLLIASHLTFGSLGAASILSLFSNSTVAVIATYSAFGISIVPELVLPERRISLRKWSIAEPNVQR